MCYLLGLKKLFKPVEKKQDYTSEEIKAICGYLRSSDNIYDYAIRFAFNLCARIGEIRSIKFSDIDAFVKAREFLSLV